MINGAWLVRVRSETARVRFALPSHIGTMLQSLQFLVIWKAQDMNFMILQTQQVFKYYFSSPVHPDALFDDIIHA
ncbi:hypothetical protein VPH35_133940 [Triticum aestivum]